MIRQLLLLVDNLLCDFRNLGHGDILVELLSVRCILWFDCLELILPRPLGDIALALAAAESKLVRVFVYLGVGASNLASVVVNNFFLVAAGAGVLADDDSFAESGVVLGQGVTHLVYARSVVARHRFSVGSLRLVRAVSGLLTMRASSAVVAIGALSAIAAIGIALATMGLAVAAI